MFLLCEDAEGGLLCLRPSAGWVALIDGFHCMVVQGPLEPARFFRSSRKFPQLRDEIVRNSGRFLLQQARLRVGELCARRNSEFHTRLRQGLAFCQQDSIGLFQKDAGSQKRHPTARRGTSRVSFAEQFGRTGTNWPTAGWRVVDLLDESEWSWSLHLLAAMGGRLPGSARWDGRRWLPS